MSKKVAIVQSNYIPWKGYFDLISAVDEFILFDDVQYTKRDWRNRNKIKTDQGSTWLTIPVEVKGKYRQQIQEVKIKGDEWQEKHWKSIIHNYSRSLYFDRYRSIIEKLYFGEKELFLSQVNYRFIKGICEILRIDTKISWSMDYKVLGSKTERLINLCKQVNGTEYLSGSRAKVYIDCLLFDRQGIQIKFVDYSNYPEYRQLFPPFDHHVSILDLIFNEGPNAHHFLKTF